MPRPGPLGPPGVRLRGSDSARPRAAQPAIRAAPSTAAHTSTISMNVLYWYVVPHQLGWEEASMRSASSGSAASVIGDSNGRNSSTPASHAIVVALTSGVMASRAAASGSRSTCPAASRALPPSDQ